MIWIPATISLALEERWADAIALGLWSGVVISLAENVVPPLLVGETLRPRMAPDFVAMRGGPNLFGAPGLMLGPVAFTMTAPMLEFWRRRADPELQTKERWRLTAKRPRAPMLRRARRPTPPPPRRPA